MEYSITSIYFQIYGSNIYGPTLEVSGSESKGGTGSLRLIEIGGIKLNLGKQKNK